MLHVMFDIDGTLVQSCEMDEASGGKIMKPAQDVFGGDIAAISPILTAICGEVAWADFWKFNPDGSLIID